MTHQKQFLLYGLLQVFLQLQNVTFVAGDSCPQSIPTVTAVNNCPRNITEYIKSNSRKQCHWVTQNCTSRESFEYHCLPDKFQERFYEVCAPVKYILGRNCPFYDSKKNSIETNLYQSCKEHAAPCPDIYNSSMVYKYQGCYGDGPQKNADDNNKQSTCICTQPETDYTKAVSVSATITFCCMTLVFMFFFWIRTRFLFKCGHTDGDEKNLRRKSADICVEPLTKNP